MKVTDKWDAPHKEWLEANPIGSGKWSEGADGCQCRGMFKCEPCVEIEKARR